MPVVPAFMRNRLDSRMIWNIDVFFDRKSIEFGAEHQCPPWFQTVKDHGKPCLSHVLKQKIRLQVFHVIPDHLESFVFFMGYLRDLVQVLPQLHKSREQFINRFHIPRKY